jgi:hypothetical protein
MLVENFQGTNCHRTKTEVIQNLKRRCHKPAESVWELRYSYFNPRNDFVSPDLRVRKDRKENVIESKFSKILIK